MSEPEVPVLNPARYLQAALSDFPWDELTPEQQDYWARFSRGEVPIDGVYVTPSPGAGTGRVVSLNERRENR